MKQPLNSLRLSRAKIHNISIHIYPSIFVFNFFSNLAVNNLFNSLNFPWRTTTACSLQVCLSDIFISKVTFKDIFNFFNSSTTWVFLIHLWSHFYTQMNIFFWYYTTQTLINHITFFTFTCIFINKYSIFSLIVGYSLTRTFHNCHHVPKISDSLFWNNACFYSKMKKVVQFIDIWIMIFTFFMHLQMKITSWMYQKVTSLNYRTGLKRVTNSTLE